VAAGSVGERSITSLSSIRGENERGTPGCGLSISKRHGLAWEMWHYWPSAEVLFASCKDCQNHVQRKTLASSMGLWWGLCPAAALACFCAAPSSSPKRDFEPRGFPISTSSHSTSIACHV
jgi:hypothetical protein